MAPEVWNRKADQEYDIVTDQEAKAWLSHPVTQSLIHSLSADLATRIEETIGGYDTHKDMGATTQAYAKRVGEMQTLEKVLDRIDDLGKFRFSGDEYDQAGGTHSSN